jgi:hypothetical protein
LCRESAAKELDAMIAAWGASEDELMPGYKFHIGCGASHVQLIAESGPTLPTTLGWNQIPTSRAVRLPERSAVPAASNANEIVPATQA